MSYGDGSIEPQDEDTPSSAPDGPNTQSGAVIAALATAVSRLRAHLDYWPQRHVEQKVKIYDGKT